MEITAHIPPRAAADWTDAIARSAKGKPVTMPMRKGEVARQTVGKIKDAKIEHGFLVLVMQVQETTPTGTISVEVLQKLRARTEVIMSARIIPNLKVKT